MALAILWISSPAHKPWNQTMLKAAIALMLIATVALFSGLFFLVGTRATQPPVTALTVWSLAVITAG